MPGGWPQGAQGAVGRTAVSSATAGRWRCQSPSAPDKPVKQTISGCQHRVGEARAIAHHRPAASPPPCQQHAQAQVTTAASVMSSRLTDVIMNPSWEREKRLSIRRLIVLLVHFTQRITSLQPLPSSCTNVFTSAGVISKTAKCCARRRVSG